MVTARGRKQIAQLGERFRDERIDAVYSSDLARARETAAALSEPRGLTVITTAGLREVNMGAWEDRPWGELEYMEPQMHANFSSDPAGWIVSGSETYAEVIARMTGCINEIARRHDGGVIAIVTHGFAMRAFFCGLLELQSHESRKVLYCDNTAVALLNYIDGSMTIEYQSDNSHLSTESSTFAHQNWWRAEAAWRSENLHFLRLDETRDREMIELFNRETGVGPDAESEYSAYLMDDAAGMLGINISSRRPGRDLRLSEGENGARAGWLSYLYLKPEFRRMNLGVQLIGQAISDLRKLGKEYIQLEAPPDSPAIKLCLKDGFEVVRESDGLCLARKRI